MRPPGVPSTLNDLYCKQRIYRLHREVKKLSCTALSLQKSKEGVVGLPAHVHLGVALSPLLPGGPSGLTAPAPPPGRRLLKTLRLLPGSVSAPPHIYIEN